MSEETSSMVLLVGSGLLVGLILVLGTWTFIWQLEDNTLERVVARDLGLALATIISSPGDMDVRYTPTSDSLRISINRSIVTVTGETGSSTYRYPRILQIDSTEALLVNAMSVPIRKQGNLLFFEEITTGCDFPYTVSTLPLNYQILGGELTNTREEFGEYVKNQEKITSARTGAFLYIQIVRGEENIIEYIDNDERLWNRRVACNIYEEDPSFQFRQVTSGSANIRITLKDDDPEPIINAIERLLK